VEYKLGNSCVLSMTSSKCHFCYDVSNCQCFAPWWSASAVGARLNKSNFGLDFRPQLPVRCSGV